MNMTDWLTWAAIAIYGFAALLWFGSTVVKVSAAKVAAAHKDATGWAPAQIVGDDGSDFYATVQLQSKWSRWAAFATGAGLALQAIATALGSS